MIKSREFIIVVDGERKERLTVEVNIECVPFMIKGMAKSYAQYKYYKREVEVDCVRPLDDDHDHEYEKGIITIG